MPIDFSKNDPVAQIMKFEPIGMDRACDCIGYECMDVGGKNVTNGWLSIWSMLRSLGGGLVVAGAYIPNDPSKLQFMGSNEVLKLINYS